MNEAQQKLHQDSFYLLRQANNAADVRTLTEHCPDLTVFSTARGVKNLLEQSAGIKLYLQSKAIRRVVEPIIGKNKGVE